MPQSPLQQSRMPIRIAQGEKEGAPVKGEPRAETHAGQAEGKEAHNPGEIPDPKLLYMNSILVALLMLAFAFAARRKLEAIPKGLQNFAEFIVEALNNFTIGIIGPHGQKYTPLVGTVFFYILLANLIGQIPGFHSPTANISLTLALGVIVFVYVQIEGIRNMGPSTYIQHFAGGSMPWQGILIPIKAILLFPVELISELVKPFTLAIRLFGNIFGEDVIILVLAGLGGTLGGAAFGWIPIQLPLLLLALLTAFVQAMVFAILTCIYLSLMHHEHEEGHGDDGAHHEAPAPAASH
jgi:F-type H+-transporting ATPase subunit a